MTTHRAALLAFILLFLAALAVGFHALYAALLGGLR